MKCLVLTFLSTAAVCTVISTTPAAAQDTVAGAPRGTAPVTVEGYGNSSESTGPSRVLKNSFPPQFDSVLDSVRFHCVHGFDPARRTFSTAC